jgi:uncharacterized membrane protein YfcA
MTISLALVVLLITLSHSLFGAGILTFGVPIFLILGQTYDSTITILIPLSFVMSTYILWQDRKYLRMNHFIKSFIYFSLPLLIIISLLNLHSLNTDILKIVMAFVLILFGAGRCYHPLQYIIFKTIRKYSVLSFLSMGALQGYANMGGSMMIPLVTMDFDDKIKVRLYNSLGFSLFTFFQIIIHFFVDRHPVTIDILSFLILGLITHFLIGNRIHSKINLKIFYHLLTGLMILSGMILAYQALRNFTV